MPDLRRADHVFLRQRFLVQQLEGAFHHRLRFQKEMPALAPGFFQGVEQRALNPHGVQRVAAGLLYDGVHPLEAEAGNLAQPVGAFPDQGDAAGSEMLIDAHGCGGRHLEGGQDGHKVPERLTLGVPGFNLVQSVLRNAANFQKLFRVILNHVQRTDAEPLNDGLRRLFADVLDKAGGKIPTNTLNRRGNDLVPPLHLELKAVLSVDPLALQVHLNRGRLRKVVTDGSEPNQVVGEMVRAPGVLGNHNVRRFEPENTVFACLVVEQGLVERCYNTQCVTSF